MESWNVTEEQQTLGMGEEGKGEMHCQSHGHSGDDKEEVLRNTLDKEARHTTHQNSSYSTLAPSKSALTATDFLLTQNRFVQSAEK